MIKQSYIDFTRKIDRRQFDDYCSQMDKIKMREIYPDDEFRFAGSVQTNHFLILCSGRGAQHWCLDTTWVRTDLGKAKPVVQEAREYTCEKEMLFYMTLEELCTPGNYIPELHN